MKSENPEQALWYKFTYEVNYHLDKIKYLCYIEFTSKVNSKKR